MKDFAEKVAVVTGAASGMGRAFAQRFAEAGMKLVIADVDEGGVERAAAEMRADGHPVLAVATDVSKLEAIEHLAQETLAEFGAVHLVCNNAVLGLTEMLDADLRERGAKVGVTALCPGIVATRLFQGDDQIVARNGEILSG